VKYSQSARYLTERVRLSDAPISLPEMGLEVRSHTFRSKFWDPLPKGNEYQGFSSMFKALLKYYLVRNENSNKHIVRNLEVPDGQVQENRNFKYHVLLPRGGGRAASVIFLLHGLNERSWDKYLPWACELAAGTGSAIILFPLSFHMNRAPAEWADPRLLYSIARERRALFPDVRSSSFANAAISTRLQLVPQRLCYSGLQSLLDLQDLAFQIRAGLHPDVEAAAHIDVFGYSIGGMVGELLLLDEDHGAFSDSRLLLFCGGATLDLSYPVSRSILDSEALHALATFYGTDFDARLGSDELLSQVFSKYQREASVLSLLMHSRLLETERRERFKRIRERIMSVSLSKDTVIPPLSVLRSVNGDGVRKPDLDLEMDFPFPYSHESPFPVSGGAEASDSAFERTFAIASLFLSRKRQSTAQRSPRERASKSPESVKNSRLVHRQRHLLNL